MSDKLRFNFVIDKKKTIRNIVLVLAIGLVLGMTAFLHHAEPKLKWSELIKVTTGAFVLIGLIYSIMTYELTQKKNQNDHRMQKMASTYNACSQWYSKDMIEHSKVVGEFEKTPDFSLVRTDVVKFFKVINEDDKSNYTKSLICIFNYFESISIASNENLMDESFVKKYFSGIFGRYYNDYIPLIDYRRSVKHNPDIWVEFTKLVEKWKTK